MSQALPAAIVARLTDLAQALTAWSGAHRDAPLVEQEQAVLGLVQAALPDTAGSGLAGLHECPERAGGGAAPALSWVLEAAGRAQLAGTADSDGVWGSAV